MVGWSSSINRNIYSQVMDLFFKGNMKDMLTEIVHRGYDVNYASVIATDFFLAKILMFIFLTIFPSMD